METGATEHPQATRFLEVYFPRTQCRKVHKPGKKQNGYLEWCLVIAHVVNPELILNKTIFEFWYVFFWFSVRYDKCSTNIIFTQGIQFGADRFGTKTYYIYNGSHPQFYREKKDTYTMATHKVVKPTSTSRQL